MATFTKGDETSINTVNPDLMVVNNKPSNTAGVVGAIVGESAITLGKEYVKADARQKFTDVNKEFQEDLKKAEEEGRTSEYLQTQLHIMVEKDPSLEFLYDRLSGFRTVEQQRRGAMTMMFLRGEAELKKAIRRTPGMRSEIAQIARDTLGFDANGAMINALMDSFKESSGSGQDYRQSAEYKYHEKVASDIREMGGEPAFLPNGDPDQRSNIKLFNTLTKNKTERNNLTEERTQGVIKEQDYIARMTSTVESDLVAKVTSLFNSANMVPAEIGTQEEYNAWTVNLIPALGELERSLEASIYRELGHLSSSAEGEKYLRERIETVKDRVTRPIKNLIASDDLTTVKRRIDFHKTLMQTMGMNIAEANTTLLAINEAIPGLQQQLLPMLMSQDPALIKQAKGSFLNALDTLPDEELMKLNLHAFTKVLIEDEGFNELSKAEKLSAGKQAHTFLGRVLHSDTKGMSDRDYDAVARSLAAVYDVSQYGDKDTIDRYTDTITSGRLPTMIKEMESSATDGKVKAGILADRTSEFLIDSVYDNVVPDISDAMQHSFARQPLTFIFDAETGTLSYKDASPEKSGGMKRSSYFSTVNRGLDNKKGNEILKRFNGAVETLYELREYSPNMAELSKADIAQVLFARQLGAAGVEIRGELKAVKAEQAKKEAPSVLDIINRTANEAVSVSRQLLDQ